MKRYRIIDNQQQTRNCLIEAENKNDAIDKGAHELKTWNIWVILVKHELEFPIPKDNGNSFKYGFYFYGLLSGKQYKVYDVTIADSLIARSGHCNIGEEVCFVRAIGEFNGQWIPTKDNLAWIELL